MFDAIVIGSGFGGAVTACRLAQHGYRVLVLERGRRWDNTNFPRKPTDDWLWDIEHPERCPGWLDLRRFPNMTVIQGAAVGGGSLVYANVSCEAPENTFTRGWPAEVRYADLKRHYDEVKRVMNVQEVPDNQWTERMKLMKEAAVASAFEDRFRKLELAVTFDRSWTYAKDFVKGTDASVETPNAHGALQGTCVHLGNCDIGCDVHAKNTLDRNYLYLAENKYGAEVRALHLVTNIEPMVGGYRVRYEDLHNRTRMPGVETARIVIVAAGSLGSTELLLRCRDITRTLPDISGFLGRNWSSNGDFLTPAFYRGREVEPTHGPTIGSAISFLDGGQDGHTFWIQDGGLPNLAAEYLRRKLNDPSIGFKLKLLLQFLQRILREHEPLQNVMPWFAQGVDAANGMLTLERKGGTAQLTLLWDVTESKPVIDAIVAMHKRLSRATAGRPLVPPTWSLFADLITPHPLGGCNMGVSRDSGVVDHRGEVFGYRNLYVIDGAIVPEALGVNPSRTIAALAERAAEILVGESR